VECLSAREDVRYRCLKIWKELDPVQKATLQAIAEGQFDAVEMNTLTGLQDLGLVDQHQGSYRLFSPLFQRIITTQETETIRIEGATTIGCNDKEIIVAGKVLKGN
ncbi:MAG: hypothetical protein GTO43_10780, partial [Armatimonadetes bacterium]|nr:hypothetical protein [Armatimonadota bacterium]